MGARPGGGSAVDRLGAQESTFRTNERERIAACEVFKMLFKYSGLYDARSWKSVPLAILPPPTTPTSGEGNPIALPPPFPIPTHPHPPTAHGSHTLPTPTTSIGCGVQISHRVFVQHSGYDSFIQNRLHTNTFLKTWRLRIACGNFVVSAAQRFGNRSVNS